MHNAATAAPTQQNQDDDTPQGLAAELQEQEQLDNPATTGSTQQDQVVVVEEVVVENTAPKADDKGSFSKLFNPYDLPRGVATQLGGIAGQISAFAGLGAAWAYAGEPLFNNSGWFKIGVLTLMEAAFPATFITADFMSAVFTGEQLEFWLGAVAPGNKGPIGGAYKAWKDSFKKVAEHKLGLSKEEPANRWSAEWVKHKSKKMAVDVAGMTGGFVGVARASFLYKTVGTVLGLNILRGVPIAEATAKVANNMRKYVMGSLGFSLAYVTTKEVSDVVGGWGYDTGRELTDEAINGVVYAGQTIKSGVSRAANAVYDRIPSTMVGRGMVAGATLVRDGVVGSATYVSETVYSGASKVGNGVNYVGETIVGGARRVGNGANYVGETIVDGARRVGNGANYVGETIVGGARRAGNGMLYYAGLSSESAAPLASVASTNDQVPPPAVQNAAPTLTM